MINSGFAAIEGTAIRPQHSLGMAPRPLLSVLALVLSLSFGAGQVRAQCGSLSAPSTTWQNGGNSFWDLNGNWTSGTPTASTNACIVNGTSTVALNGNGNAKGLQLATGNTLNINPGASLSLASGTSLNYGTLFNSSGTITNSGTLANHGSIINSGEPFIGFAVLINNSGAFLTNNGAIGLSGLEAALFNNSGAYLINNGTIGGAFADLGNSGTFINNSAISMGYDSTLGNAAGGYFANSGTISLDATYLINGGTFNNSGTISVNTAYDPSSFANSGTFNNSGTINLGLFFNNSVFSNSGTLNNKGTINLGDSSSCGAFCLISVSNSGTLNNKGTLNITTSASDSTGLFGLFTNSGTINNSRSGTLSNALTSTINNTGTINNTSGANFNNFGTLTNNGIFNNTSGAHLMDAGTINNSGIFANSGTVTISSTGLFTTSTNYTQTAGRTVVNGTLTANSGAIVDIQGGALSGTGTIDGDVLMKAIMSPASSGVPGTLTINGNYEQTSTGVFDEIIKGSSSNGLLDVTGVLALDPGSSLEITLQGGFNPVGDSFTILDYGSLADVFSNGTTFFADGFQWTLSYGPNDAVLTAVSTPEPNTMPLIAISFLALLGFAAKRAAAL